jgi:hypothetical protein
VLLPEQDPVDAYVIRASFSDPVRWGEVADTICASFKDIETNVRFINDPKFDGTSPEQLLPLLEGNSFHTFAFIVDRVAIESAEYAVLVMDLYTDPGRTFRAVPSMMPSIYCNLSIANMDFEDFADYVEADGVFRGFPE